jgi:hypothetical protein
VSERVKVTRELATEDRRRVDIVVESPDLIIGIGIKINAGDQKAQLHDYYAELKRRAGARKTAVLVYLTLDGKPPSARKMFAACLLRRTSAGGSKTVQVSVSKSRNCPMPLSSTSVCSKHSPEPEPL